VLHFFYYYVDGSCYLLLAFYNIYNDVSKFHDASVSEVTFEFDVYIMIPNTLSSYYIPAW